MGEKRLVSKVVTQQDIVKALMAGDITFAQAQAMYNGVIPIGDYKGAAAALDVDLLVKQPLVHAEGLHVLGILDGREEDYDLQTITIPNGAGINAAVAESLTVPIDEVWFILAMELFTPADVGGTPAINWHNSLWTDRAATPSIYGQPYHLVPLSNTPFGQTVWEEFHSAAPWMGGPEPGAPPTNKLYPLRLPGGTVLTFVAINLTALATGNMACTAKLYGYIGKALVD